MGGGSPASIGGSGRSSLSGHGHGLSERVGRAEDGTGIGTGIRTHGDTSRPPLGRLRRMSANDVASSGGSAEVMGRMELDEEPWARGQGR
jgi:autophagy-related protein 13